MKILFENVSYKCNDKVVLRDVNLELDLKKINLMTSVP